MTDLIGDWPSDWEQVPVGDDPEINESKSDGEDEAVRVIPPHLDDVEELGNGEAAAVLVLQDTLDDIYWLDVQSKGKIIGGEQYTYRNERGEHQLSKREAEEWVETVVKQLQNADKLSDTDFK